MKLVGNAKAVGSTYTRDIISTLALWELVKKMTTTKQMRIKGTDVRLRQEPSTKAAIAALMQDGAIVHVDPTKTVGGFVLVRFVNGYIHEKYLVDIAESKIW